MFDVIVVGSGPAGVFAARELTSLDVLMLDVGYEAGGERLPAENLHVLRSRERDLSVPLLGEHFESLHNIDRSYLSPKLKAPLMRFITETPPGERDVISHGFAAVRSYAKGGLANAWGAGVFRYDEHDLAGYPVSEAELGPFYDDITKHVGISGAADDLAKYFGSTDNLQPPLPLGRVATRLLRRYQRKRARFNANGISLGHLRSAILTQPHRGREAHTVRNQEFYQPNIPSVYHPGYTLDEMRAAKQLTYVAGMLVQRYEEHDDRVDVFARDVRTGETVTFSGRHLVLAAGALNSAAIALAAHDDHDTRLPILDNLLSYVPLLDIGAIGFAYDAASFSGAELCLVYDGPLAPQRVQGSFYGLTAPLKGDLFFEMPLSARGNFAAMKYVLPAIGMLQMFYPDRPDPANHVRLGADGALHIQYTRREFGGLERHLIAQFLRAGYLSAPALCQYPEPGSSMHYAGTLPMKSAPSSRYESDRFGQLHGSRRVRVADGAALPVLPSKNHTFTIMANAARIARHLRENLV